MDASRRASFKIFCDDDCLPNRVDSARSEVSAVAGSATAHLVSTGGRGNELAEKFADRARRHNGSALAVRLVSVPRAVLPREASLLAVLSFASFMTAASFSLKGLSLVGSASSARSLQSLASAVS